VETWSWKKRCDIKLIDATIERFVKEYLDIVVLALIAGKPMCGTDILDIVHRNFNVLLSPGTIYPLLHRLKKEGLLECECSIKKKVYKPAKGSEANIQRILNEHSLANEFLNDFLKSRNLEANTA
jgi:DNA-binding PadR family transcriptional regulator